MPSESILPADCAAQEILAYTDTLRRSGVLDTIEAVSAQRAQLMQTSQAAARLIETSQAADRHQSDHF